MTGDELAASLEGVSGAARESAIRQAIEAGHLPPFLLAFRRVETAIVDGKGRRRTCVLEVSPDVLGVGRTAGDYLRTPVDGPNAAHLAALLDCALPTPRISDAIWSAADVRLPPRPLTAGRESTAAYVKHNQIVHTQLGAAAGALVAGHKKDICPSNAPGRVAIYGWHMPTGKPIQDYSTVHDERYADYSHGVRLVRRIAHVDGAPITLDELASDPELRALVAGPGGGPPRAASCSSKGLGAVGAACPVATTNEGRARTRAVVIALGATLAGAATVYATR